MKYLNLQELYYTTDIDEDFLAACNRLYPKAFQRVLEKNANLRAYIETPREAEYDTLDFEAERIIVRKVFIRKTNEQLHCEQDHELTKKSVAYKVNDVLKGVYMWVCPKCKKMYTDDEAVILEKLEHLGIPYEIIQ